MMFTQESARKLLEAADVFFGHENGQPKLVQTLNLSDVFSVASADGEYVKDEELPEVADLYSRYGWCGIVYWVSKKRRGIVAEFHDVNRFIEFARVEEEVREYWPDASDRAYRHISYKITG